ncbi:MAG: phosphoribosylformylglycinamidine synthase, partial [Firmicutes bacterium]|nr:phosphoribosylformylglycinamidine synthase [Bacillota bacterium]
ELGRTEKPETLMDLATVGARYLKAKGILKNLDESPEINACTVKIKTKIDGRDEDWLLLFKNETHNHPTEIEPFGGAATCLGGAIRDPLSGRSYVYQAMRLTGAADPTLPISETMAGKLPQRRIVTEAAAGYSSYGNQIGLATGLVDEWYHPGYAAKRMEIGAVVGAAPAANVRRLVPGPGDVVILLGGRTGRDGCGGATGSSKSHDVKSIENCGAEVQKGNAPEERKLQRLFRLPEAAKMIKRCNDFGAGGVSVAIGELADGLRIDLDKVPRKYEGLVGTELAISESQERMAVVVAADDAPRFAELAAAENLETAVVAEVTEEPRLVMTWRGKVIVDLSRSFLDTNGALKHTRAEIPAMALKSRENTAGFAAAYKDLLNDLNCCSHRGLAERFDSTIGAASVLMPFGGKRQLTPAQVMAAKLPVTAGETSACSVMSWGFDPYLSEQSPYHGSYLAVVSSVLKLVSAGAPLDDCYLSFQEYFPKLGTDARHWGQPAAALLGALAAQLDLELGAIGGKDSMSGTFEKLEVPPTLVSFAITMGDSGKIISPEFKKAGSQVVLMQPDMLANGLPTPDSLRRMIDKIIAMISEGKVLSAYVPGYGGVAEAVFKMGLGNGFGFRFADDITDEDVFARSNASVILELAAPVDEGRVLGYTVDTDFISGCG